MTPAQKLKCSVYTDTRKICREVGIYLNMEFESDVLDVIAELAWSKLQGFGADLEAFQKHAKRTTINADDVKLLVRKNESLKEFIEEKAKEMSKNKTEGKTGKRKRKGASATST